MESDNESTELPSPPSIIKHFFNCFLLLLYTCMYRYFFHKRNTQKFVNGAFASLNYFIQYIWKKYIAFFLRIKIWQYIFFSRFTRAFWHRNLRTSRQVLIYYFNVWFIMLKIIILILVNLSDKNPITEKEESYTQNSTFHKHFI